AEAQQHDDQGEAAVEVRPGDGEQGQEQEPSRMAGAVGEDRQRPREQDDREQLGPERERGRGNEEAAERQEGRWSVGAAHRSEGRDDEQERGPDERRAENRESRPATELVDGG